MSRILVVTDAAWIRDEAHATLTDPDLELIDTDDPVAAAVQAHDLDVDVVVVDLQIASMGGMAVARDIRNHADLNDLAHIPVVMLLDRVADAFLAKRAGAAAWLTKPVDGTDLRNIVRRLLEPEPQAYEAIPDNGADDGVDDAPAVVA
jgi:DNA-binding response OmpR family regulator